MPQLSKDQKLTQLVCICGFVNSGKTTVCYFLKKLGFQTFIVDEWVHQQYQKNQKGYQLIKQNFGSQYVNQQGVDRVLLKKLILQDLNQKAKLEKIMNAQIYRQIQSLQQQNELIFVELATYLFFAFYFAPLFAKIVLVQSTLMRKRDDFKRFFTYNGFSTQKPPPKGFFGVDYIINNNASLQELEAQVKLFLRISYGF